MSYDPHAVRWYRRENAQFGEFWTKWHGSSDSTLTWCGRRIPLAIEGGSFLPGIEEVEMVNCRRCLSNPIGARIVAAEAEAGGE